MPKRAWASVRGRKVDHRVGRHGLVRRETGEILVTPVRNVYNPGRQCRALRHFDSWLHDVKPVAVKEECVIPEQRVELRNQAVILRNRLSRILGQCFLDL
jgi:hypothetical protein